MPHKIVVIGLILLIILLAIPLGIGMVMGACPECAAPGAPIAFGLCLALVFVLLIAAPSFATAFGGASLAPPLVGHALGLERPPRPA